MAGSPPANSTAIRTSASGGGSSSGCRSLTNRSDPRSNLASAGCRRHRQIRESCETIPAASASIRVLMVRPAVSPNRGIRSLFAAASRATTSNPQKSASRRPAPAVDSKSRAARSTSATWLTSGTSIFSDRFSPGISGFRASDCSIARNPPMSLRPGDCDFSCRPLVLISTIISPSSTRPLTATGAGPAGHIGGEFEKLAFRRLERGHFHILLGPLAEAGDFQMVQRFDFEQRPALTFDFSDRGLAIADLGVLQVKGFPNFLGVRFVRRDRLLTGRQEKKARKAADQQCADGELAARRKLVCENCQSRESKKCSTPNTFAAGAIDRMVAVAVTRLPARVIVTARDANRPAERPSDVNWSNERRHRPVNLGLALRLCEVCRRQTRRFL